MNRVASAIAINLIEALKLVVNLWLQVHGPQDLAEFISIVPLTPLLKPGNSILPLDIGLV